ncbi:MAG: 50S ribosomal protein L16 [Candidatus Doudnabacteria bacterium RIFCSPLOWO2_02_FULL_48_8]|uniref:Large ribosomal subunit protein uL16 n=1 Tax=Candidatus Doudnabacteria bacterium RIFCSPHIGHO2_01_FULL_46_24 TaxID=1817825 RepID=A0A1F5NVU5_9BACT|nr:ribosomal protein L16 [uncultured bacterium]OGE81470.1 MAG: 50S ribosomal protein L16 [Candidatus Doudnabacteria bacterium RIFCSPHIGHO2_01_FULL_46_24]OGE95062.1 MAG: 50S ribosomal protein L16 [Candidatus Doudnabacteria bacterium RIFCSPLOWO2_02_FULL_48_8]OGE95912.1 MAG: 50S ribosomal protein L16 [Candidatus Doudnabacteria bacterium RIFCSPHIGHO2_12_FULL_48_11]
MLIPKRVKHRKHHRGRSSGKAMSGNTVAFGSFGLKAVENSWVTSRQIEAARRAMTRYVARGGKIWIRIFPDKPITSHGNESPMGSGKGAVDHFVAVVRKGRVLFEMDGVPVEAAAEAMRLASHKLPIKTRFITKERQ